MIGRLRALGGLVGAIVGGAAWWVFINTNPVDVQAAAVDGFPLWSTYQVPFLLPGVLLGLTIGFGVASAVTRWRQSARPGRRA